MDDLLRRVGGLLADVIGDAACLPPTMLYNEGWLLRLTLDAAAGLIAAGDGLALPLSFGPGDRWYSEPLLASAFLPQFRGDPLAEDFTRADAVIGRFDFRGDVRAELSLAEGAAEFVVLEAKVGSRLSSGTRNAPGYHQAARIVACMAETLARAGRDPAGFDVLAFHVLAPEGRIDAGVFDRKMTAGSIEERVGRRVEAYGGARRTELDRWMDEWLRPLLAVLDIRCIGWESIIGAVSEHDAALGRDLDVFYNRCLHYNGLTAGTRPSRPVLRAQCPAFEARPAWAARSHR